MAPDVLLSHLHRADGSATYSHGGYAIVGAVNGPMDVQRRDELPEQAAIEVNVRPAAGAGTPRERHIETLLHRTLHAILLVRQLPRTLIQITVLIRSLPEADSVAGVDPSVALLPHLLHTAFLALLSASLPLRTTITSALVAIPADPASGLLLSPTAKELLQHRPIQSVHVFAFSGHGKLLLSESDGAFTYEQWEEACDIAQEACSKVDGQGGVVVGEGMEVDGQSGAHLDTWLREVVNTKVRGEQSWKSAT